MEEDEKVRDGLPEKLNKFIDESMSKQREHYLVTESLVKVVTDNSKDVGEKMERIEAVIKELAGAVSDLACNIDAMKKVEMMGGADRISESDRVITINLNLK